MRGKLISVGLHLVVGLFGFLIPFAFPSLEVLPQKPTTVPIYLHLESRPEPLESGGGTLDEEPASQGAPPLVARQQFILPPQRTVDHEPALEIAPTITGADIPIAQVNLSQFGDPFARPGPPSGGSGHNGYGGPGEGGVGPGDGPGFGGSGAVTGPTTGPEVLSKTEPEFSDEARKAKLQGTVVVEAEIGLDGKPHNLRVRNGVGLGLDERAVESVAKWRFRPAMRAGRPIVTTATIYVNFRLL